MKPVAYRPPQVKRNLGCRFKASYASEESARRHYTGHKPYRCTECGRWHTTSQK